MTVGYGNAPLGARAYSVVNAHPRAPQRWKTESRMQDARRFIDRYGFRWQVCELWSDVPAEGDRVLADVAPPSRGWLYFFSRGTTLVLHEYPTGWEELTWQELEALRERARVLGSDTAIRVPRREVRSDARPALRVGDLR